MIYVAATLAET